MRRPWEAVMGAIPKGDRLCRETVRAAREFAALELWRDYADDEVFGVRVPGEPHPLYCAILGRAEAEVGLGIMRGETAARDVRNLLLETGHGDDPLDSAHQMSLTMGRLRDVPSQYRKFLTRAGIQARRDARVPVFITKEPGKPGRGINQTEALLFLYALRGIITACELDRPEPTIFGASDEIPVLAVSGDPLCPEVSTAQELIPPEVLDDLTDLSGLPRDLSFLPRLDATWQVGFQPISASVREDDRSTRALLVVDVESELVLFTEVLMGRDINGAVDAFYGVVEGRSPTDPLGLPERLVISNRPLFDALAPDLADAGVNCDYDPAPVLLDRTYASLEESIATRENVCADLEENIVPAPDDRLSWSVAEQGLVSRLVDRVIRHDLDTRRARVRFFGDEESAEAYLAPDHPLCAIESYYEWLFLDYRATTKSRTIAEKVLEKDSLPAAHRLLLEARMRARPGIYLVETVLEEDSVELVEVFTGERVAVADASLSRSGEPHPVVLARVFEAGAFQFITLLGPVLTPLEVDPALEYLHDLGLGSTPDDLARSSHLLGRLWTWIEERSESASPIGLTNTDGDQLEFQTACFEIEDEEAVLLEIETRDDIEEDEEDGSLVWLRREPNLGGGETVLGRLEFVADEVLLDVNSTNRLLEARSWLEKIPGVTYLRRTLRHLDDEPPMDDLLSRKLIDPPPPEAAEALREMFLSRHMAWLDEAIPMFGGMTPREMCQTEEGRARVAAYIRTMPDPGGPLGTDIAGVPREAMLKDLGLE
jgi:Domain of unknown function (DUF6930)/Antitoxin Xre/MbcA/ParS C-terminal toxin-binding domain